MAEGIRLIRPWHTWIIFGVSLLVVLAAMSWVTLTALRLDKAQADAQRLAAIEENVRLALWRMDSSLATLIAQENSQPWFAYSSFYSAEEAFGSVGLGKGKGAGPFVPSPLLAPQSPLVLLHFQMAAGGEITSPEVPGENLPPPLVRNTAIMTSVRAASQRLLALRPLLHSEAAFASLPQPESAPVAINVPPQPAVNSPADLQQQANTYDQMPQTAENQQGEAQQLTSARQQVQQMAQLPPKQRSKSAMEQQQRAQTLQMNINRGDNYANWLAPRGSIAQGVMQPLWLGDALVLARRVDLGGIHYVQGCWLDWPAIRSSLVENVRDLLPSADVQPVRSDADRDPTRMLAALPAKLIPGAVPIAEEEGASPLRQSLFVAWGSVVLAAVAVAVLLLGTLALSERRGTFVSAVTHELRTPLTTFRLYAEMLAEKMISEEKRQSYLDTLHVEAERLSHLVENVLSYARLENRRGLRRMEKVTVRELLDRTQSRLAGRAQQAGRPFVVEAPDEALSAMAVMDTSAVEQILLNLVDNACKYSGAAADLRVHLEVAQDATRVALRVRDHGPGISRSDARKLFRPFSKSAREAANSAPGIGLGLALSRRLARSMGGDLRLDGRVKDGACFELLLRRQ